MGNKKKYSLDKQQEFWKSKELDYNDNSFISNFYIPDFNAGCNTLIRKQEILFFVDTSAFDRLMKISNGSDLSLYIILATFLKQLMYKYTDSKKTSMLTPFYHDSNSTSLSQGVLLLQDKVFPESSLKDNIIRTRKTIVEAYTNQDYDLSYQVSESSRKAVLKSTVLCSLSNIHDCGSELSDVSLHIEFSRGDTLKCILRYDERLDADLIKSFGDYFSFLLANSLSNLSVAVNELKVLSDQDVKHLIQESGGVEVKRGGETIYGFFEEQVDRTPDRVAVLFGEQSITYKELNKRADHLGRYLVEHLGMTGIPIPLLLSNGIDMIISILGVLKAGCYYIPISKNEPQERVTSILQEVGASLYLTDRDGPILGTEYEMYDVDRILEEILNESQAVPSPVVFAEGDSFAYAIFTSGTSGRPKGIRITHNNIMNSLIWRKNEYRLGIKDVVLQLFSYTFDGFVTSFFTPVFSGSTVVIIDDIHQFDISFICNAIQKYKVTHFISVPIVFESILEHCTAEQIASLKVITLAGDIGSSGLIKKAWKISPGLEFVNEYGPTEAAVVAAYCRPMKVNNRRCIGRPIENTSIYILDKDLKVSPVGIYGEICIQGPGVSQGYINDEKINNEKFILHHSLGNMPLYRTGDIGRWIPDGTIEILGRKDNQVKLRGYRIELDEIRFRLLSIEGIEEAYPLVMGEGNESILYAVLQCGRTVSEDAIREFLATCLSYYMIPQVIVYVGAMPRNNSGKVDTAALKAVAMGAKEDSRMAQASDETEKILCEIWCELLGLENVGVNQNFFQLGGHSLKATNLASRIHSRMKVNISMNQILTTPTIRELANIIKNTKAQNHDRVEHIEDREEYSLSSEQMRMLFLHNEKEAGIHYNVPLAFYIKGRLDLFRLQNCLDQMTERHEIFRTSIQWRENQAVQIVHPSVRISLHFESVEENQIDERITAQFQAFDLSVPPLFRASVLSWGDKGQYLVFDFHHMVIDGVSLSLFLKELCDIYNGQTLIQNKLQYRDYVYWQENRKKSREYYKTYQYWQDRLIPEKMQPLKLPFDRNTKLDLAREGMRHRFHLRDGLILKVKNYTGRMDVTPFIFYHACLTILLHRYANTRDITIGTSVAGRNHTDLFEMEGLFVNTIPIYTELNTNDTFHEYISRNKELILADISNGELQYDEIVKMAFPNGRDGQASLFNVFLVVQELRLEGLSLDQNVLIPYPVNNFTSKFDLNFEINITDKELYFVIEYPGKYFEYDTIQGMADSFCAIVEQVISTPEKKLDQIRLAEVEQLQGKKTSPMYEFPNKNIVSLFEEQVMEHPYNIALECAHETVSYLNLNRYAERAAALLTDMLERDEIVAVICERSIFMVACVLGILKAGGAYLPIDPEYPSDRILYMLRDCNVRTLFTNVDLPKKILCENKITEMDWKRAESATVETTEAASKAKIRQDGLAYIIYTSGTTGSPKGVMVSHENVVNLILNNRDKFIFDENDTWTMFHSLSFDFSVWELFGALLHGGRLLMIPSGLAKDPEEFYTLLSQKKVSILNQTPTAFYSLVNELAKGRRELNSLRYVIFGGEALNPAKLQLWKKSYPHVKLINMYGITETTVHVTYKELKEDDLLVSRSNIGQPIDNVYVYILDGAMGLCPVGATGEIYIGGRGISKGYMNKKTLTSKRFLPDPFAAGRIIYKSGDLGKRMLNGDLIYFGRADSQVKIRGHRIELAEIDTVLARYPGIRETAVICRNENEEYPYLAAYFTAPHNLSTISLKEYFAKFLPVYMIPSYVLQVPYLPRTVNGKIDAAKLPDPRLAADFGAADRIQELDAPARRLQAVWSQVLGLSVDKIRGDMSFFNMGGDSIKAILLLNKIRQEFDNKISIAKLYENPSILAMCELLREGQNMVENPESRIIQKELEDIKAGVLAQMKEKNVDTANIQDIYPLSDIESGMLYYYMKDANACVYHDQILFQLECKVTYIKTALKCMAKRHSMLRASLNLYDYLEPVHIIYEEYDPDVIIHDIRRLDKEAQISFVQEGMRKDREVMFSPPDPFWRVIAFRINTDTVLFLLAAHHAVLDGWSVSRFQLELKQMLLSCDAGGEIEYLPMKNTYKQYIIEQRISSRDLGMIAFWKEELKGAIRLSLPVNEMESSDKVRNKQLQSHVSFSIVEGLQEAAMSVSTDIKTVYLAAAAYLFNMLSYENDFVMGVIHSNRPVCEDGDKILGCFLNTIPLRTVIQCDWSYAQLLENINKKMKQLRGRDQLSLLQITRELELSDKKNPLFDCTFNYVNFDIVDKKINDLCIPDKVKTNTMLDLTIDATFADHVLHISFDTRIEDHLPEVLLECYKNILQNMASNIHDKMRKDLIMPKEESQLLLYELNRTQVEFSRIPVHTLFESQAAYNPNGIGVVFEKQKLSYGELNSMANALAWKLRDFGIKQNDCVAVLVDISADMVTAFVSVLKSGGAFMPIDQKTPHSRIDYILENSNCKILITHSYLAPQIDHDIQMLFIDDEEFQFPTQNTNNPPVINTGHDLAYMIYTSGTTGNPKGVMIEHYSLVNYCQWNNRMYAVSCKDRVTKYANYGFDVSIWEMAPYLIAGAMIHILPEHYLFEMKLIDRYLTDNQITIAYFPTPVCEEYMQIAKAKLRYLLTSGDKLRSYVPGNYILANNYGPTETTINSTCMIVDRQYPNIPIGKPISNTTTVILDKNRNLQMTGVIGELCIGGAGLARGYYGNAELTRQKFFHFEALNGERMYSTGDLVRMGRDGNIEYIGRNDRQIKLRGFRIELEEIEGVLNSMEGIHQAVVVVNDTQDLHAFIVADAWVEADAVKDTLAGKLSAYMIPKDIHIIPSMPLTANGKVDYPVLEGKSCRKVRKGKFKEPCKTPGETKMYEIWRQVLHMDDFSVTDSFFELGGDSIKAMQVITRLSGHGMNLDVNDIFDYKTIRALTEKMKSNTQLTDQSPVMGESGLSPIQRWFFHNIRPNFNHWNQAFLIYAPVGFQSCFIEQAFHKLIEHHDILRARFSADNKGMSIDKVHGVVFVLEEDFKQYGDKYAKTITEDSGKLQASLNIQDGPLMVIKNYKTETGDYLLIAIHHLLVDGVSWRILFEDFTVLYRQLERKIPLSLLGKTCSYYDYIKALENYMSKNDFALEFEYWCNMLSKPFASLYCVEENEYHKAGNFETLYMELNEADTSQLVYSSVNDLDASMFSILLYSLGTAMRAVTGNASRFQVMLESHGRDIRPLDLNLTRTVGWFTQIYPFILETDMLLPLKKRIQKVESDCKAFASHRLSYNLLTDMSPQHFGEKLSSLTKYQIIFNYLGDFDSGMDNSLFTISNISTGSVMDLRTERKESLSISAYIVNERLHINLSYDKTCYDGRMTACLKDNIESALYGIIGNYSNLAEQAQTRVKVRDGVYGFNELFVNDCFYHALIPAVRSFGKDIHYLFANIFSRYSNVASGELFALKNETVYAHDVRKILDMLSINHKSLVGCVNVCNEIVKHISSDSLVIVNLDCYYLKNKVEMFGKTHWSHSVLVYGYDKENMEFYVLDSADIFALKYGEKKLSFQETALAYEQYNIHFNAHCGASMYILSEDQLTGEKISISPRSFLLSNVTRIMSQIKENQLDYESCYQNLAELLNNPSGIQDIIDKLFYTFTNILNGKKIELYKAVNILCDQQLVGIIKQEVDQLNFICNVFRKLEVNRKVDINGIEQAVYKWRQALNQEKKYNNLLMELSKAQQADER